MSIFHSVRVFCAALKLDGPAMFPLASKEELCYGYQLTAVPRRKRYQMGRWAVLQRFFDLAVGILHALKRYPSLPGQIRDSVAFFEISRNHRDALRPIASQLPELARSVGYDDILKIRRSSSFLMAPLFVPSVIYRWFTSTGYERESFRWAFDQYVHCHGLYFSFRRWLHRDPPRVVVLSNDHVSWSCTLRQAAQDEGITTVYVQHACVTDAFPPLQFDVALLDGSDAVQKYRNAGASNSVVRVIGMPKLDAVLSQYSSGEEVHGKAVGITFSHDSEARMWEIMEAANRSLPGKKCIVRPHPACPASVVDRLREMAKSLGMDCSDPSQESPLDFLPKLEVIICGASSIAVEAAILGVVPIMVLPDTERDIYGFAETGLVLRAPNMTAAISLIEQAFDRRDDVRDIAKWYCASLGTEYEGKSGVIAANLIREVAANDVVTLRGLSDPLGNLLESTTCRE